MNELDQKLIDLFRCYNEDRLRNFVKLVSLGANPECLENLPDIKIKIECSIGEKSILFGNVNLCIYNIYNMHDSYVKIYINLFNVMLNSNLEITIKEALSLTRKYIIEKKFSFPSSWNDEINILSEKEIEKNKENKENKENKKTVDEWLEELNNKNLSSSKRKVEII